MSVFEIDPCTDPRWPEFVNRHPEAGIFHTQGWLKALRSTYGYAPVAFTTSTGQTLTDAVVFCENKSPLTGRRLVSLPFSDHCQPLASADNLQVILHHLKAVRPQRGWRYIEIRPAFSTSPDPYHAAQRFSLHKIDLRPPLATIQKNMHESCIRRKVKRAERENLTYEEGRSEALLQKFRILLLLTRRRHGLPPQPAAWFRNVAQHLGDSATIHMVSKDNVPVASIFTLRHKQVLTYKYGCSDASMSNLGGTPLLFWKVIQQAKESGAEELDLGRSDADDPGLNTFKHHLGGIASELVYARFPAPSPKRSTTPPLAANVMRQALTRLPDPLFAGVGRLVYRHIG